MSNTDFDKNLFITYLDEVKAYTFEKYLSTYIVSISMKKNYYIEHIEPKWKNLREKYSIPEGTCLHFTDIKALLNKSYYHRPMKQRKLDIEKVFCNGNVLDKDKLYNFYLDIIDIIDECEIDVLVTGIRQDKSSKWNECKKLLQNIYYTLLRNHLDNLAEYMIFKSDNNKRWKTYRTQLLFDGDRNFKPKESIIYAFTDVKCNGTERFNAKYCMSCFENLELIDKDKVGLGVGESHAGNELLDFIALYAAKYYSKDMMINDYINYKGVSEDVAKERVDKNIQIYIGEKYIYPYKSIEKKVYKTK